MARINKYIVLFARTYQGGIMDISYIGMYNTLEEAYMGVELTCGEVYEDQIIFEKEDRKPTGVIAQDVYKLEYKDEFGIIRFVKIMKI